MLILGIESSCDETAAAVVELSSSHGSHQKEEDIILRSNVVQGQLDVHKAYGGVVPELASRAHIRAISPVVESALKQAGITANQLDGIAVTKGPGLIGGLLVGLSVAKGMAMALKIPLIGVHHMEGHLMSPFLQKDQTLIKYPFVALLVSGGHSLLLYAEQFGNYELMGQTRDDAAGEAFDKGARMLGLPYPGGPAIAHLAQGGNPKAVAFPRAHLDRDRFDFSFSGLKTSLRTYLIKNPLSESLSLDAQQQKRDIAASYQEALVEILAIKSVMACKKKNCYRLMVAGGVGANQRLREVLQHKAGDAIQIFVPPLTLCTDNGAMIALAGLRRLILGQVSDWSLNARSRWPLSELCQSSK